MSVIQLSQACDLMAMSAEIGEDAIVQQDVIETNSTKSMKCTTSITLIAVVERYFMVMAEEKVPNFSICGRASKDN